ncbi:hypothetical protein ACIBI9_44360 [Nonomuraea sp. NPDC050451]|uniref:hypothetical protein n=1 Tax=Nonomuraea sp. NPDC050451 TaxID=3364364 RepID=UPI0037A0104A
MSSADRWIATKIDEPGIGDAFAGVSSDPAPRKVLSTRLQGPYRPALGELENRVLLFIDVLVGTLLHRMGMTGEPTPHWSRRSCCTSPMDDG